MRSKDNFMYYDFINYFVSSVIGKMDYKKKCCSNLLSTYATVSNEAFAILSFENNFDTWMDMGVRGDTKTSQVPRKYTNGGKSQNKTATSQHNKGWSDEGLNRFNVLFDLVEKNRASPYAKQFEEDLRKWCEAKAEGKKRKKVEKLFVEAVQVRHELWSDDEDEGFPTGDPYEGTGHKRIKMDNGSEIHSSPVSAQLDNELLATPLNFENENSDDESAGPMPDKSVFARRP